MVMYVIKFKHVTKKGKCNRHFRPNINCIMFKQEQKQKQKQNQLY